MKKILKVDNPNVYAEYVGAPLWKGKWKNTIFSPTSTRIGCV